MRDANLRLSAAIRQAMATKNSILSKPLMAGAMAACVAFTPALVSAQTTTTEQTLRTIKTVDDGDEPQPEVTSIGKTPQLLRDIPQTISVIDRDTIEAQGATTLTEVLRNVPGITLSAGEGGNIGDNVNLRGFSARTDLYIDGIRDRSQYSRETAFLESVEVLKGPSSMLFGRGSTGGVINQVTKQPNRRESASIGASVGTESYYRLTADLNQPIGESAAFRVAAFGHTNESTRDIVESERYGIAPSVRLGIGQATEFTLSAIMQRRDDIPDYGFPFVSGSPLVADRDNFYGYTDDYFRQDVNIFSARVSHEFTPSVTMRNQTQYTSAHIEARPTTINGTTGVRNPRQREIDDSALFNQTDLIVRIQGDTLSHTITAGAEIGRDDYEAQTYTTTASLAPGGTPFTQDFANPTYGPLPADAVIARQAFTDNVGNTLAFYVNEQLDIGAHWKLVGGVRWDRFEIESIITPNTGLTADQPDAPVEKTDTMTSVRAGVVYQPDEMQTYYASYGTSFNPSAETLTLSEANRNVDPEKNQSYELGAKLSLGDGQLLLTGAIFRVEKTDARTTDAVFGTVLDGDIRVQGIEFGVSGNVTDAWKVLAGYTYLDGEILRLTESGGSGGVRDGNDYLNTPKHSASFWTTYELPLGLQFGGGLVYVDDRYLNNANTSTTDGYARFDATAAYIADRYSVRVNLQNVTDKEYFEVASGGRATPATGRTVIGSFSWNF
jgi:catecholate siderophore receptor